MKYIAFITDGESPVRYATLTDEHLKLMYEQIEEEDLEPNFTEIEDPEVISTLDTAIAIHLETNGAYVDEHGNTFIVEHEDDSLNEWVITMQ